MAKKPIYKKVWFWILIVGVLAILGNLGESSTQNSETQVATESQASTSSASEEKEMVLNFDQEVFTSDANGVVTITGKTEPGAEVSVGLGLVGDSTVADSKGQFTLTYDMGRKNNKSLTIMASKADQSVSKDIAVRKSEEATASSESYASEETKTSSSSVAPQVYHVGDTVKVGDISYVINSVEQLQTVGSEYLNETANGVFVVLTITVTNESSKKLDVSESFFNLVRNKTLYESDSSASLYANDNDTGFWLESINPGITMTGKVAFDVPADVASAPDLQLQVQTGVWGTQKGLINLNS